MMIGNRDMRCGRSLGYRSGWWTDGLGGRAVGGRVHVDSRDGSCTCRVSAIVMRRAHTMIHRVSAEPSGRAPASPRPADGGCRDRIGPFTSSNVAGWDLARRFSRLTVEPTGGRATAILSTETVLAKEDSLRVAIRHGRSRSPRLDRTTKGVYAKQMHLVSAL